jgi:hypothetical protein
MNLVAHPSPENGYFSALSRFPMTLPQEGVGGWG